MVVRAGKTSAHDITVTAAPFRA